MTQSTTMKISLPRKMRDDIKSLVQSSEQYSTTSGFMQKIIDRELKIAKETKKLNDLIKDGMLSGVSKQSPDAFFKSLIS